MMKKLFRAALVVATFTGFQAMASIAASAADAGQAGTGLLQYSQAPTSKILKQDKSFKLASRYSRRRNRNIAGGVLAAGVAAIIINEAIRNGHGDDYYEDRHHYSDPYRSERAYNRTYNRTCRRWARRCDNGVRRACRRWARRCQ